MRTTKIDRAIDDTEYPRNSDAYFSVLCSFAAVLGPWIGFLSVCLLFFGPIDFSPEQLTDLTGGGRFWVHLERDVTIYVLSIAICVLVSFLTPWEKSLNAGQKLVRPWHSFFGLGFIFAPAAFWDALKAAKSHATNLWVIPICFGVCTMLISFSAIWLLYRASSLETEQPKNQSDSRFIATPKLSWIDILVCAFFTVLILIPLPGHLAGLFFQIEELNHWNGFLMGAAEAFKHGAALYRDTIPIYGVAWPILFGWAAGADPLNYSHAILTSMWVTTVYLSLLYYLFRQFSFGRMPAFAFALLAAVVTTFPGVEPETKSVIWRWSGGVIMRAPCDILFFILLVKYCVAPRWIVAALLGFSAGLSLLFTLDVGFFLCVTLAMVWLYLGLAPEGRQRIAHAALSFLILILTSLTGLLMASRGTLFSDESLASMLEYIRRTASGFGLIPFADLQPHWVGAFNLEILLLLAVLTLAFRRRPKFWRTEGALLLAASLYPLQRMIYFMGRTHWANLISLFIPVLIATTLLLLFGRKKSTDRGKQNQTANLGLLSYEDLWSFVCICISVLILLTSRDVPNYPALWNQTALRALSAGSISLRPEIGDVLGLPAPYGEYVGYFKTTAKRISELNRSKLKVRVLDACSTTMYVLANVPPYGKDTNELDRADVSKAATQVLVKQITTNGPEVIVLNRAQFPWPRALSLEAWKMCRDAMFGSYRKKEEFGPFEIWYRNGVEKP